MKVALVRCHGTLCMIRFGFRRKATTAAVALSPAQACSQEPNMSSRHEQVHLTRPESSIFTQKRRPYSGNLNSQTFGDSENAFLHYGDV